VYSKQKTETSVLQHRILDSARNQISEEVSYLLEPSERS
jgi:hypothetical protein